MALDETQQTIPGLLVKKMRGIVPDVSASFSQGLGLNAMNP